MKNCHCPGKLALSRFLRNRLAMTGAVLLGGMLLFSFAGGILSPYSQHQVFYREQLQEKEVAAAIQNESFRLTLAPGEALDDAARAVLSLAAAQGQETVDFGGDTYRLTKLGRDLFDLRRGEKSIGFFALDIYQGDGSYEFIRLALTAYANDQERFSLEGTTYFVKDLPISRLLVSADLGADFTAALEAAIAGGKTEFSLGDRRFFLRREGSRWSVTEALSTRVWDSYAAPSKAHPLGTDKNGMDTLTRLMYGGRVSLLTGISVVLISAVLGGVIGALSGYFGRWTDELLMRLVDVFYCIPTTPLLIILGALMDALRLDFRVRLWWLIVTLGLLGWPEIARMVRGQILSLRQQEFMLAAEALGLTPARRIFRHLLPNVFPQLTVMCTMRLGSTILTEATLSFLGLGIKFPFASWGNILSDAQSVHVLTGYPYAWLPAGLCLVLSVLAFNFLGDGLRDALDPKGNIKE